MVARDAEKYAKWQKDNLRQVVLKLHRTNDKDVLDHLEKQPNKREYLIGLIRKDMKADE